MGATCCNNDTTDRGKEIKLTPTPNKDSPVSEKAGKLRFPRISKEELDRVLQNFKRSQFATKRVLKLQAWFRGINTRKFYPIIGGIKPITIIRCLSKKLSTPAEAVSAMEKKLGPYVFDWDITKNKAILELRRPLIGPTGEKYVGYWNKQTNQKEGYGQQIYPNGAKYEGMWKNGLPEGEGRYIYETGDYYIGNRIQGKANGQGVYVSIAGNTYVGEWMNDLYHGKGKEICADKTIYKGEFSLGKKQGFGKFLWSDGSYYEGNFVDNMFYGKGKYQWINKKKYQGEWRGNKMNGKGKLTFPDGKEYVGEFVNDLMHGYGTMSWPNGTKYEGTWANGKAIFEGKEVNGTEWNSPPKKADVITEESTVKAQN